MTELNIFRTTVGNLSSLSGLKFSIPSFQRPYVWTQEEINKLLQDFWVSFQTHPTHSYFVGTVLTKHKDLNLDLIDGQQRFTTLWLVAYAFRELGIQSDLSNFLEDDNKNLRLGFEIREEVTRYCKQLLGHKEEGSQITSLEIEQLPYLRNIAAALTTIKGIITKLDLNKLPAFGNFIYYNIYFVKNETPDHTNLNKLYSTINSSGVQLEQADILKAKLLKIIEEDKMLYSKIWETCQNMNNFFERNARAVFSGSDWSTIDLSEYKKFDGAVFKYKADTTAETRNNESSIDVILKENTRVYNPPNKPNEERESEDVYCRSIINFSQLLLHTYRLHLYREGYADFEGTFHINRLIEVFSEMEKRNDQNEIKRFFHLLWDVRFVFDKYIIKWIPDQDQKSEQLELININKSADGYYPRNYFKPSDSMMLQSVLYFTGDYLRQFWLTPFIGFLISKKDNKYEATDSEIITKLEQIDNQLSLCKTMTGKEASFLLLKTELEAEFDFVTYLNEAKGTGFQHYWFQKLEYVLWKNWTKRSDPTFKAYRITSKNSVEHIYPQTSPQPLNDISLHSFGNLVLLSVSQNSEYGNKAIEMKRAMFKSKTTSYDTLKSSFIFEHTSWTEADIKSHREEMIRYLVQHYQM